ARPVQEDRRRHDPAGREDLSERRQPRAGDPGAGDREVAAMPGLVALVAVLLAALYFCWLMFQPFFNVLLWAAVLCVVFYPMHRRILARTGKPTLAAACSTLLVILFILLP